jgi:hypothetical protein
MSIKLTSTLFLVFFLSISSVQAGTISKPPYLLTLTSGLVGHWTFDGANITNGRINDISGQGNHGNSSGIATSTFYAPGKIGQGVKFDGVDDYVNLGALNQTEGQSQVTFSGWVYYRSLGSMSSIIAKFDTNDNDQSEYFLGTVSGNEDASLDDFGLYMASNLRAVTTNNSIAVNTWYHLVAVYDGTQAVQGDIVKLYKNGVLQTDTQAGTFPAVTKTVSTAALIGRVQGSFGSYTNGTLDDVRVYNRALSASEITSLYSFGASKLGVTKTPTGLQSGLVGHWTFDGKDMPNGVVRDISGSGNNGNTSGISTSTFYTLGKIGQGVQFDGVNDYVNVGTLGSFGASDGQAQMQQGSTVSMWVKTTNTTDIMTLMGNSNANDTLPGFGISLNRGQFGMLNGQIRVSWTQTSNWGSIYIADATGINDGNWHHIVAVHKLTGTQELWIDGQSKATVSARSLFSGFQSWSISPGLGIGAEINAGGTAQDYFRGSMDDVRIYNRTLSAAEIAELYSFGASKLGVTKTPAGLKSGLVGHWTFDGKDMSGGVARDISGQGNNGNLTNIATSTFYTAGKIGQGVKFDGVDDKVTTLSDSVGTSPTTISMWLYPRSYGQGGVGALITNGVARYFINSGSGTYRFRGDGATTAEVAISPFNQWVHLVMTRDVAGVTNFYKDGVQVGSANQNSGTPTAGGAVVIGNNAATSNTFDGSLDDVRIYNRVLSTAEILQLYNAGR